MLSIRYILELSQMILFPHFDVLLCFSLMIKNISMLLLKQSLIVQNRHLDNLLHC